MTSGKGARRVGLLAALLVLAAATEASAQAAKKSWFERIDANGDGAVEPGELAVVVDRQFGRLDVNNDGNLSLDEMPKPAGSNAAQAAEGAPKPEGGAAQPDRRVQARFARLDRDDDGRLSSEEFRVTREGLFRRLDANKDGKLNPEEAPGPRGRG
jgi:hypothetical protein